MPMHSEHSLKRLLLSLLIMSLFTYAATSGAATEPASEMGRFPSIRATSLDGRKLHLPQEFSGQINLVIISFAREQQHQVDTWIPVARQIQSAHSRFSYYELPTLSSENPLYRWWFDASLRSNTADKDLRSRILTAYVNKRKFSASLRIASERKPIAILVNRTGKVFWRAVGSCTEQKKADLLSALAADGL